MQFFKFLHQVSSDMIEGYIRKYSDDQHKLAAFFQLKTALAPCIESLIILDRICFLLEQVSLYFWWNIFILSLFVILLVVCIHTTFMPHTVSIPHKLLLISHSSKSIWGMVMKLQEYWYWKIFFSWHSKRNCINDIYCITPKVYEVCSLTFCVRYRIVAILSNWHISCVIFCALAVKRTGKHSFYSICPSLPSIYIVLCPGHNFVIYW